ncbi:MAG: hypothetical protein A3G33_09385 [Omnitrophica bacterium RIFCSPLOWO2_12_FULL_44_17]|uniref:Uncharacterized protein n=1 Tax=Candidatus Danuiimicrobium aquiferis TaxID=1801832 RepID=A0A1G1KWY2_9BACT|nr:MAG: hypothetical protein A3B72_09975 [Omnitrophica bacterium RIFCSPHIGHO2_02_FULL_45_28]OGW91057.1 MAG: hypothetical protein A3E74_00420 [Omnitrophica bacterium RIFCSPHIGHO2_12_FULL_44_12]OGW97397.1 MAG: hypothetical protein A3G33_09385 [Omnitrophica bacterium RIFCSPLOWO2_12_FULL_44_17]OGX04470.1 MAG: hypothetical protein A3J12_10420 [Omnitrophica bacterium RIFCSPLOWO2_02_FULL_44_11]
MEYALFLFTGVVTAKVLLYQARLKNIQTQFFYLFFYYLLIFSVTRYLHQWSLRYHFVLYEPLPVMLIVFVSSWLVPKRFRIEKTGARVLNFYMVGGLCAGLSWLVFLSGQMVFLDAAWAFAIPLLYMMLTAIWERLAITVVPGKFSGIPIFLISVALLLLSLNGLCSIFK